MFERERERAIVCSFAHLFRLFCTFNVCKLNAHVCARVCVRALLFYFAIENIIMMILIGSTGTHHYMRAQRKTRLLKCSRMETSSHWHGAQEESSVMAANSRSNSSNNNNIHKNANKNRVYVHGGIHTHVHVYIHIHHTLSEWVSVCIIISI